MINLDIARKYPLSLYGLWKVKRCWKFWILLHFGGIL